MFECAWLNTRPLPPPRMWFIHMAKAEKEEEEEREKEEEQQQHAEAMTRMWQRQ